MDIIANGKRFGSDRAHGEAAYCAPLLQAHLEHLRHQGIEPAVLLELRGYDEALTGRDRGLAEAEKLQEKRTDALQKLMSSGVDIAARAWTFAVKAFRSEDADALESFPKRANIQDSIDRMVRCLNDVAAFVSTREEAMQRAGAPAEFAREIAQRVEEIIEANRLQEAARQATRAAAGAVYAARGEIHLLCGLVYLAGRAEYRRSPEVRGKFCYQFMTRDSGRMGAATGDRAGDATGNGAPVDATSAPVIGSTPAP